MHRIDNSSDPNFWSMRVNRDVRLIIHKTGDSLLVAYVDHHDKAYAWAERRRIEALPERVDSGRGRSRHSKMSISASVAGPSFTSRSST